MYVQRTRIRTHVFMYSVAMSRGLMSCSMDNVQRTHSVRLKMCVIIIIRENYRFFHIYNSMYVSCPCVRVCCMQVHYACLVRKNICNKLFKGID